MIYIELENNTPVKSTSNAEIAVKYFKNIITTDYPDYTPTNKKYKYENGEITWEEYMKKSPYGYECWSCGYCGKWTGSFKYR